MSTPLTLSAIKTNGSNNDNNNNNNNNKNRQQRQQEIGNNDNMKQATINNMNVTSWVHDIVMLTWLV
jgi:hypothetical protein